MFSAFDVFCICTETLAVCFFLLTFGQLNEFWSEPVIVIFHMIIATGEKFSLHNSATDITCYRFMFQIVFQVR